MLKTTSPYLLDTPAVRYRKIEQRFKQKILFLLKSDSLLGGYKYHDMGQAAGLTETVDETTCLIALICNHGQPNSYKIKYFSVRSIAAH